MSISHFVADTYPYRPGTTMRTGKPCSSGNGCPFIANASIDSRSSVRVPIGVPAVKPSLEVDLIASASDDGPAPAARPFTTTPDPTHLPSRHPPPPFLRRARAPLFT